MMKIEAAQLPEDVKDFLNHMFYLWDDFPPSWLTLECDLEDDTLEVIMRWENKETQLDFTKYSRETWALSYGPEGECKEEFSDMKCENLALFQMIFNMRFKKEG